MAENVCFLAKESPNVVLTVKHWKIHHAIFNVLFCSVFSNNVLLDYF